MFDLIEIRSDIGSPKSKILNGHCPVHHCTGGSSSLASVSLGTDREQPYDSYDQVKKSQKVVKKSNHLPKMIRYSFLVSVILLGFLSVFVMHLNSSNLLEARLNFINRLLKETPLIAGHCGSQNRDFYDVLNGLETNHVSAIFWPISVPCGAQFLDAVQLCLEKFDEIKQQIRRANDLTVINNVDDLQKAHSAGNISLLLGIEGGHSLGDSLGVLRSFYELGARFVTIDHSCDTVWTSGNFTDFGQTMIAEMNRLGIVIDLSSASEQIIFNVLAVTRAPIVFSHAVIAGICGQNVANAISDQVLVKLAMNGGILMIDTDFELCQNNKYTKDDMFDYLIDNLNYVRKIAGVNHIGFGSVDFHDQYAYFLAELVRHQEWSSSDIKKVVGANLIRVLQEIEVVKNKLQNPKLAVLPYDTNIPIEHLEDKTYCRFPDV